MMGCRMTEDRGQKSENRCRMTEIFEFGSRTRRRPIGRDYAAAKDVEYYLNTVNYDE
jgi:hypothetical protein